MDRGHKKKPDPASSSPSSSNGDIPPYQPPKAFERRVSADAASVFSVNSHALPPKMTLNINKAKSPEPIITEPSSPLPLAKHRFGSTDLISNGRSHSNSPLIERSHHQTSSQSVTVKQSRQYQEIVDGPNGRQVVNYSAARQNSHKKDSEIQTTEVNGEVKIDADHKVSSTSAAKASIEALDSMGECLRAACAALSHTSNVTNSNFSGSQSGIGELTQSSKTDSTGKSGILNEVGGLRHSIRLFLVLTLCPHNCLHIALAGGKMRNFGQKFKPRSFIRKKLVSVGDGLSRAMAIALSNLISSSDSKDSI